MSRSRSAKRTSPTNALTAVKDHSTGLDNDFLVSFLELEPETIAALQGESVYIAKAITASHEWDGDAGKGATDQPAPKYSFLDEYEEEFEAEPEYHEPRVIEVSAHVQPVNNSVHRVDV